MKFFNKILSSLMILSALAATGCATNSEKTFLQENNISIEGVHSQIAHVERLNVTKTSNGILIRGAVRRYSNLHGSIPGYVGIEIIGADGQSKLKSNTKYHRKNRNSKWSIFKFESDIVPEKGSVIRVTHHWGMK